MATDHTGALRATTAPDREDAPDQVLDPFLTPQEVAEELKLPAGVHTVYELARKRARDPLPVIRIGKYLRIPRGEFHAWLERQRVRR